MIVAFYYLMRNNTKAFNVNKLPSTIVVIWSTFSPPLFVTLPIDPPILVRFKVTFLFCINTTTMSNTLIITKVMFKKVIIFYFLENNIEYKIFKIVKIATAIIKFIAPLISKVIPGRAKISFIVFESSQSKSALISKLTIG